MMISPLVRVRCQGQTPGQLRPLRSDFTLGPGPWIDHCSTLGPVMRSLQVVNWQQFPEDLLVLGVLPREAIYSEHDTTVWHISSTDPPGLGGLYCLGVKCQLRVQLAPSIVNTAACAAALNKEQLWSHKTNSDSG